MKMKLPWPFSSLLTFILILCGCQRPEETSPVASAEKSNSTVKPEQSAANSDLPTKTTSKPTSLTGRPSAKSVTSPDSASAPTKTGKGGIEERTLEVNDSNRILQVMANITKDAQTAEANQDYDLAKAKWSELRTELESRFGADSWQVRNVDLTLASLETKRNLTLEQRRDAMEILLKEQQAAAAMQVGKFADAETALIEAIQSCNKLWPNGSPYALGLQTRHAFYCEQIGNYQKSEEILLFTLKQQESMLGANHPDTVRATFDLARIQMASNKRTDAVQSMQLAIEKCKACWTAESETYVRYLNDYAALLHKCENYVEAEKVAHQVVEMRKGTSNGQGPAYSQALFNLSQIQTSRENYTGAEGSLKGAIAALPNGNDKSTLIGLDCHRELGTLFVRMKRFTEASSELSLVLEGLPGVKANAATIAQVQFELAVTYGKQGKYAEAEPLLKEALKVQASDPRLARSRNQTAEILAIVFEKTGRAGDASSLRAQVAAANSAPSTSTTPAGTFR